MAHSKLPLPPPGFYWVRGVEWTVARVDACGLVEVIGEAVDRSDYFGSEEIVEWGPRIEPPDGR